MVDFDECKENEDNCSVSENEKCVNINGSFTCECTEGYSRNTISGLCSGKLDYHSSCEYEIANVHLCMYYATDLPLWMDS